MREGLEKSRRYLLRKGWLNDEDLEGQMGGDLKDGRVGREDVERGKGVAERWWSERKEGGAGRWWTKGENGVRWFVEFGTAYAIVKVAMPLRIIGCVWATPWFARVFVVPFGRPMWATIKAGGRRVGSLFGGG